MVFTNNAANAALVDVASFYIAVACLFSVPDELPPVVAVA